MTRETFIAILGFFVIIVPFLGFPLNVKDWILVVLGVLIVGIGIGLRHTRYRKSIASSHGELRGASFIESSHLLKRNKNRDVEPDAVTEETV